MFPSRRRFLELSAFASGAFCFPALAQEGKKSFAIVIHGGAGKAADRFSPEEKKAIEGSLGQALDIGVKVLKEGGASLDAVEQVIRFLEDDPLFNAGKGAVFNAAGGHELDSSIMDGKTKGCGAVAAVRTVRHPISLARLVMDKTKHVLLASDGAEKFADEMKVERVENSWFDTDKERRDWERTRAAEAKKQAALPPTTDHSPPTTDPHYGTVGCCALDSAGNLAAGTSTGGISNKKYGRVGDSPIVGAGTYADNATCAVSGTGIGEQYIRNAVAYDISARMRYLKQPLQEAVAEVMHKTLRPGDGGLIALGADGTIVTDYSTGGMARAAANATGLREIKIGK
jgi:beta-aspartyl-peptidase (threonine type)